MLAFTDAEDHALMLSDMKQLRNDLKRERHMRQIRKLEMRKYGLRIMKVQKQMIRILSEELKEGQTVVKNIFSKANAVKDHESKGYLLYLLDMQEYHRKKVDKLNDQIKEQNSNIQEIYFKICSKRKEYARFVRTKKPKMKESKVVELYQARIEHLLYEMGRLTEKNRQFRDSIEHMYIRKQNYYKKYDVLQKKNSEDELFISTQVEKAVHAYRNREEYVHKAKIMTERFKADVEKVRTNNCLLHRLKEREAKAEKFDEFKMQKRSDCRALKHEEDLKKRVTGLEPELESATSTYALIAKDSEDISEVADTFEKTENLNFNFFCYISTLHEEIDQVADELVKLKHDIIKAEKKSGEEEKQNAFNLFSWKKKAELAHHEMSVAKADEIIAKRGFQRVSKVLSDLSSLNKDFSAPEDLLSGDEEELIDAQVEAIEAKVVDMLILAEYHKYLKSHEKTCDKKEIRSEDEEEEGDDLSSSSDSTEMGDPPRLLVDSDKKVLGAAVDSYHFLNTEELKEAVSQLMGEQESEVFSKIHSSSRKVDFTSESPSEFVSTSSDTVTDDDNDKSDVLRSDVAPEADIVSETDSTSTVGTVSVDEAVAPESNVRTEAVTVTDSTADTVPKVDETVVSPEYVKASAVPVADVKDDAIPVDASKDDAIPVDAAKDIFPVADEKDNTVSVADVKDDAIPGDDVKDNTVPVVDMKDYTIAVDTAKDDTVSVADVKDDTVPVADVKDDTVPVADVKDDTVPVADVKDDTVPVADVKDDTVPVADVKDDTVPVAGVKDDTVPVADKKDDTVTETDATTDVEPEAAADTETEVNATADDTHETTGENDTSGK